MAIEFLANECQLCALAIHVANDNVQNEFASRSNSILPDTRDNWTRENVQHAAKDSVQAITRGQYKHSAAARVRNAQEFTSVMSEPIRVLIAECDLEELREIWIELKRIIAQLHGDPAMRTYRRRLIRIARWIELDGKYRAYRYTPRELTDNEFIATVAREYQKGIKNV